MSRSLDHKKVAVYGLGRSGLAAIRLLQSRGAEVVGVDQRPLEALDEQAAELIRPGLSLHPPSRLDEALAGCELLVVSPGVPLSSPGIARARASGVEVTGEIELASWFLPAATKVGITGTNGKSTTTALCGELFRAAGKKTFVGGNLGQPLSEAVLEGPYDAYVIELSSFQLEAVSSLHLSAAAILNLSPDHLDRYPDMHAYGEAKARIFRNQQGEDTAVINADDAAVARLSPASNGQVVGFTLRPEPREGIDLSGWAVAAHGGFELRLAGAREHIPLQNRALRGPHNLQNAMAAALLARRSGVSVEAIREGVARFGGLPHRLEAVATQNGVEWVNDSKATNVDSTLVALGAFEKNVWLILGGKGKGAPYEPLVQAAKGKVKGVLTVGEDAKKVEEACEGQLPVHACGTLERAVMKARAVAVPGDVVLLSPACASYDQFKNFEHRGETFKALVREGVR